MLAPTLAVMFAIFAPAASWTIDWSKVLSSAFGLAAVSFLWLALRPAISRLSFWLQDKEPEHARAHMFRVLDTKEGRVQFKGYIEDVLSDFMGEARMSAAAVRRMADQFEGFEASLTMHGAQLVKINIAVDQVPRLADSLDELATSIRSIADTMRDEFEVVNTQLARADEREKVRMERRQHDEQTDHKRRSDD